MDVTGKDAVADEGSATGLDTRPSIYNHRIVPPARPASLARSEASTALSSVLDVGQKRKYELRTNKAMRLAMARMTQQEEDMALLTRERDDLRATVERVEREMSNALEREKASDEARAELVVLLEKAYESSSALQNQMKEARRKIRVLETEEANEIRRLKADNKVLQDGVARAQRWRDDSAKVSANLRADIRRLESERNRLQEQLAQPSAGGEDVVAGLREELDREKLAAGKLKRQMAELKAHMNRESTEHSDAISRLEFGAAERRDRAMEMQTRNGRLLAQLHDYRTKQGALEEEVSTLGAALKEAQDDADFSRKMHEQLETRCRDLEENHRAEMQKAQEEARGLRETNAALQEQLGSVAEMLEQPAESESILHELERTIRCRDTGAKAVAETREQWRVNDELAAENSALRQALSNRSALDRSTAGHAGRDRIRILARILPGASAGVYEIDGDILRIRGTGQGGSAAGQGHAFVLDRIVHGDGGIGDVWMEASQLLESARRGSRVALLFYEAAGQAMSGDMGKFAGRMGGWLFGDGRPEAPPRVSCGALRGQDIWDLLADNQELPLTPPPPGLIDLSSIDVASRPVSSAADLEDAIAAATGGAPGHIVMRLEVQHGSVTLFGLETGAGKARQPGLDSVAESIVRLRGRKSRAGVSDSGIGDEGTWGDHVLARIIGGSIGTAPEGAGPDLMISASVDLRDAQAAQISTQTLKFAEAETPEVRQLPAQ